MKVWNPPHGWVIPAEQRDMTRVTRLVNLLLLQGIEVGRADNEFTFSVTTTDDEPESETNKFPLAPMW